MTNMPEAAVFVGSMRIRCRSCDAPMYWAMTNKGRRMPINPQPSPQGNVHLFKVHDMLKAAILGAAQLALARERGQTLYTSHFATCPKAANHRGKR